MANPQTEKDFENMSDEEFLKLDENQYSGNLPEGETNLSSAKVLEGNSDEDETDPSGDMGNDDDPDGSESNESNAGDNSESTPKEGEEEGKNDENDANQEGGNETPFNESASLQQQSKPDSQKEGENTNKQENEEQKSSVTPKETPAKAGYFKMPEGMDAAKMTEAVGFFQKITAPFKADGKDFSIRSPEDAIRLMQQGVNYSRRMQEIKPMKQLNRVLQDNNLADMQKLGFAIDLLKGDKKAITQLLKSHKIDPMDLDTEKDSGYQARNYAGNTQDNEFRDALEEVITTPEGQALVNDIHTNWDSASKRRLRENPSILGNLQQMKASGVYDKVVEELNYQKSMGYLTSTPFLQAFDTVGEAMKNAGVFNSQQPAANGNPMGELKSQPQGQPVASGARKSTATKKAETNPHLSSTPPSKQVGNNTPKTPDFDQMSDEDFLKMAPPE